ncbi:MAG: 50S ribosomal protein L29 [Deltaproteobacteria bacterium]|nr:50S ribosomal protein L29 [Deltaproteobacteria bacterium]
MKKRDSEHVDYKTLTLSELKEREGALRKSIFALRMELAVNKLKNHRSIRYTRRELARLLTVLNQKRQTGRGRNQ